MKLFFTFLLIITIQFSATSQVNDIWKELNKEKKEQPPEQSSQGTIQSSGGATPADFTAGIDALAGLFRLIGGIAIIQENVLKAKAKNPGLVSMEVFLQGGYDGRHEGTLLTPMARLNWGIFSTEFRNQRIFDGSGLLDTYDWQVLKINIPLHAVRFSGGIGFTQIPQVDLSYFEYTLNGQVRFYKEKALVELGYRSTDKHNERWFRREFKTTVDYEWKKYTIRNKTAIRLCPVLGFAYQNYFVTMRQFYFLGGINIRLY